MNKILAISWTADVLRYLYAETEKKGALRVLAAGEKEVAKQEESSKPLLAQQLKTLVAELKASKATLLLCINRGAVDSVSFQVPPASDKELPTLVRNMASRQLPGITEQSLLDFVAYPVEAEGMRKISAMVLPAEQQQLIEELTTAAGTASHRILITPHPLQIFAPPGSSQNDTTNLVICESTDAVHFLITTNQLPVLSRTVRLSTGMSSEQRTQYIAAEVQRTLLAGEEEVKSIILVGYENETALLRSILQGQHSIQLLQVSPTSLIEGEAKQAESGQFTPLIAAAKQEALQASFAIDFANPKLSPKPVNKRLRALGIAAAVLVVFGLGWYYVNAQFSAIEQENAKLKTRVNELNELVKKTRTKRNLNKVLDRWESSRICWLDELRDLTVRIPSSPELSLQQFSVSRSQKGAIVSFRGMSKSPETIRKMEVNLSDQYHQLKTPGIREQKQGKKSIYLFQTTMSVRSRPREQYAKQLSKENLATSSSTPPSKTSNRRGRGKK